MTTQTTTRDSLNDVLQDGDALLNLTSEAIAAAVPAVSRNSDGTARLISGPAYPLGEPAAETVSSLKNSDVQRFVVVADSREASTVWEDGLKSEGLSVAVYLLEESCQADAFMDQEDSEAVAERLRQLGYL